MTRDDDVYAASKLYAQKTVKPWVDRYGQCHLTAGMMQAVVATAYERGAHSQYKKDGL